LYVVDSNLARGDNPQRSKFLSRNKNGQKIFFSFKRIRF